MPCLGQRAGQAHAPTGGAAAFCTAPVAPLRCALIRTHRRTAWRRSAHQTIVSPIFPAYPFAPHYVEVDGLRIHYVDEGPRDAAPVLLLHGEPSWSYLYRKMIPVITAAGHRAVAPDLVGFGRSDKPVRREDYTYQRHVDWMRAVIERLDLRGITLVCQDWGGLIGLRLAAEHPERFARIVTANTFLPTGDTPAGEAFEMWRKYSQETPDFHVGGIVRGGCATDLAPDIVAAYDAPFPDDRYKAGARQFPMLVPTSPSDPGQRAEPQGVGGAAALGEAVPHRLQRRRPDHPRRRPLVPSRHPRRQWPAAHDDRRRRALSPGRQGRRAGQGGRRLHRPESLTMRLRYLLLVAVCWALPAAAQEHIYSGHGIAMHGDLKYGPDFKHFDYVNPDAPKGGELQLAALGTFDSFNPFIIKGNPADGIARIYDTLLVGVGGRAVQRVRPAGRDGRDAGRSLVGGVHAASRGALARRQADHRRRRDLELRDAAQQGPAVLSRLLRQRRPRWRRPASAP